MARRNGGLNPPHSCPAGLAAPLTLTGTSGTTLGDFPRCLPPEATTVTDGLCPEDALNYCDFRTRRPEAKSTRGQKWSNFMHSSLLCFVSSRVSNPLS
ncbi:hypothetical protein E2C01_049783 [Portunus trituberculatus]|uniref:Uncharacterized protein n=1 Tax=Portunus trituberculatus TaxID=210409 RepID=A0A5B7GF93_PORTR|nr:hypothetical protein [Portunus trituberculatus]